MKFRNKATKEIRKAEMRDDGIYLHSKTAEEWRKCDWKVLAKYWEEYIEEPKEYWFIDCGTYEVDSVDINNSDCGIDKEIGNYFETKEEAELAVRKLKAWKRLKDKGFRFTHYNTPGAATIRGEDVIEFKITALIHDYDEEETGKIEACLDLLFFGGEE